MSSGWTVTANDIRNWIETDKRRSEELLPELIRKLICASIPLDKIIKIDFPSKDSISTGGFDGELDTLIGNPFIPIGLSGWEISTEKDVKGKADSDYSKRTTHSKGITKRDYVYISATGRLWKNKDQWVNEKKKERKWKSVKGIDANDLEIWLSQCYSVHIWFSRLIGKRVGGDRDVDEAWEAWSTTTTPPCNEKIILAGRKDDAQQIIELLNNPHPKQIQVISSSKDESYAFILAVLKGNRGFAPRVLIVKNQESWDSLVNHKEKLILIPDFEEAKNIGHAIQKDHTVIVPKAGTNRLKTNSDKNILYLSQVNNEVLGEALIEIGFSRNETETILTETHSHIGPLRRHPRLNNNNPSLPEWIQDNNYRKVLLGQLFVGIWDNNKQNDCQKVAEIADVTCDELKRILHTLSGQDDPPVRLINNKWISLSRYDLWYLLSKHIDEPLLERFHKVAIEVLGENDPSFELKPDQRWLASIYQKNLSCSEELRSGISEMIALLATYGETDCINIELDFQQYADLIISELFQKATTLRWYSLKKCLPPLAEASPEIFLTAVEDSLKNPKPPIKGLFEKEGHFGHSGHVFLLWALESISWNLNVLSRVARVLAKLSSLDPGGQYTNRPINSLIHIFKPEFPQTIASVADQLSIFDNLNKYEPEVAWKFLLAILPENHPWVSENIYKPLFRDWRNSWIKGTTHEKYTKFSDGIVERLLNQIAKNPNTRWLDIFKNFERFPNTSQDRILSNFKNDLPNLNENVKLAILEDIRKIINKNKRYSGRPMKYPSKTITQLKNIFKSLNPKDPIKGNLFLFNNQFPPISSNEENLASFFKDVEKRRYEALTIIWKKYHEAGIEKLINSIKKPDDIGIFLAQIPFSDKIEERVLSWLGSDNKKLSLAAKRFVYVKSILNPQWPEHIFDRVFNSWNSDQKSAFYLGLPPSKSTFKIINSLDEDVKRKYWKTVGEIILVDKDEECVSWVIQQYLKYSEPLLALSTVILYFRNITINPNLIADCLESIDHFNSESELSPQNYFEGNIIDLLKLLENSDSIPEDRLAKIEMKFLLTYHFNQILPRVLIKETLNNPGFFVEL